MGSVRNPRFRRYTHQGGAHENIRTIHQCMECRWNAHVRTVLDRTAGRRVAWLARAGCDLGGIRSSVDEISEGAGRRLVAGAGGAPGGGVMGRPGTLCDDATRGGLEGAKNDPSRRACLAGHAAFPAVVSRVTSAAKEYPRMRDASSGVTCPGRRLRRSRTMRQQEAANVAHRHGNLVRSVFPRVHAQLALRREHRAFDRDGI